MVFFGIQLIMALSRTHACFRKLAQAPHLTDNKAARLAFASCFRRWVSHKTESFQEISGGEKTFAALWGNGDFGRLGLGNLLSQWRPKPISPSAFRNQSLKEVASGGAHTFFLTGNSIIHNSSFLASDRM